MTPSLTLNYGVRWEVVRAVPGDHRHLRGGDARRPVRRVRHRIGARRPPVQPVPAGHARRRRTSCRSSPPSTTKTRASKRSGGTSRRTSASRGCRVCRTAGSAASWATLTRRRFAPATRRASTASAWIGLPAATATTPAAQTNADRTVNNGNLVYPGESWPILLRETNRLGPPAVCPDGADDGGLRAAHAGVSDHRDGREQPEHHRSRPRIGVHAIVDGRLPALADQGLGDRNPLRRQPELRRVDHGELERAEHRRKRLPRRVQARAGELAGQPGRRTRRDVQLLRRRHQHVAAADLSGATSVASTAIWPTTRAVTRRRISANTAWTGHLGVHNPDPVDAANDLHDNATFRGNATTPACRSNFFVMNPAVDAANILRSTRAAAGTTRCSSSTAAGCRRACS